jgi:radical SAM protein with 4Fe4S-binding SPASM domain
MKRKDLMKILALRYGFKTVRWFFTHLLTYKQDIMTAARWHLLRKRSTKFAMAVPKEMMIVPSTICNGRCVFCSYRKLNETGTLMPLEFFKRVVDEYKALGGKKISLCPTVGECLIDPALFEKIKYAKKQGFYVYTFTNGLLLGMNDNYKKLCDSGLDELFISLGDVVPAEEAALFGVSAEAAQKKIDSITELLRHLEMTGQKLKLTLGFRSSRHFSRIWKDMKKLGMDRHMKQDRFSIGYVLGYDNWGGAVTQDELLGVQRLKRVVRFKKYPCAKLLYVSVLPDGDVRLCGCRVKGSIKDELVIGNLNNASLKDILFSGKAEELAKRFIEGKAPEICKDCSFYCPYYK